jgi:hypothetical protein
MQRAARHLVEVAFRYRRVAVVVGVIHQYAPFHSPHQSTLLTVGQ